MAALITTINNEWDSLLFTMVHATVSLSFQIEICNLDRTKSSFLATSLYKKVIFTKN